MSFPIEKDMAETYYKVNENIVARKIAGELLLVPVKGKLADMQRIFVLDPVAEYIWTQLGEHRSLEEIHRGIMERFDVEDDQAGEDLREFIRDLLEAGLIEG